jgi:hypothetical protein
MSRYESNPSLARPLNSLHSWSVGTVAHHERRTCRIVGTIRMHGNGTAENIGAYSGRPLPGSRVTQPQAVMPLNRRRSKRHSHARSAVQFN